VLIIGQSLCGNVFDSVGRLEVDWPPAMVELGHASLLATWLGPPVQAVESLPPPIWGLGTAAAASSAGVLILGV
jgi:hypothetical protein